MRTFKYHLSSNTNLVSKKRRKQYEEWRHAEETNKIKTKSTPETVVENSNKNNFTRTENVIII